MKRRARRLSPGCRWHPRPQDSSQSSAKDTAAKSGDDKAAARAPAYKVDIKTGRILWTLGRRHSNFKFGPGADFTWQHDVRAYAGSPLVTLFDDHCCQETGGGTYVPVIIFWAAGPCET